MKQKRAYQYRYYPTDEQQQVLARTFGCVRYVYNWGLRKKTDAYYQQSERLSYAHLSCALTAPFSTSSKDVRSILLSRRNVGSSRQPTPRAPSSGMGHTSRLPRWRHPFTSCGRVPCPMDASRRVSLSRRTVQGATSSPSSLKKTCNPCL